MERFATFLVAWLVIPVAILFSVFLMIGVVTGRLPAILIVPAIIFLLAGGILASGKRR